MSKYYAIELLLHKYLKLINMSKPWSTLEACKSKNCPTLMKIFQSPGEALMGERGNGGMGECVNALMS